MDSSVGDFGKEGVVEEQGKETNTVNQEENPPSEQGSVNTENVQEMLVESPAPEMLVGSPVPEMLVGSPVPEMLVGSPAPEMLVGIPAPEMRVGSTVPVTQEFVRINEAKSPVEQTRQFEDRGSVETAVTSVRAAENENVDMKTGENVQEMVVESPAPVTEEVMPETPSVEQTAKPEEGGGIETGAGNVTVAENESMETNQDQKKCDLDELAIAVTDSTNVTEQGGKVEDHSTESTELTSELMETDQGTFKEDCVTQEVMPGMSLQSSDQASGGAVTEDRENNTVVDLKLSNTNLDYSGHGQIDETVMYASVATEMEIDTQGENSECNSVEKSELATPEMPSGNVKLTENVESNQHALNSGVEPHVITDTTPTLITDGNHEASEALEQSHNKSTEEGCGATLTTDT